MLLILHTFYFTTWTFDKMRVRDMKCCWKWLLIWDPRSANFLADVHEDDERDDDSGDFLNKTRSAKQDNCRCVRQRLLFCFIEWKLLYYYIAHGDHVGGNGPVMRCFRFQMSSSHCCSCCRFWIKFSCSGLRVVAFCGVCSTTSKEKNLLLLLFLKSFLYFPFLVSWSSD